MGTETPTSIQNTPQYRQRRWLGTPEQQTNIGAQLIVGCGMGGSWIAEALRRCEIQTVHGIDPDTVDTVNLGAQGFVEEHLDHYKVETLPLSQYVIGKFPDDMNQFTETEYHTIWSLSDSLDVRKEVAEWAYGKTRFIVDIRAHWPTFEWYIIDLAKPGAYDDYLKRAFKYSDADVPDEAACSKVGTIAHAWANVGIPLHHWGLATSNQQYLPFGELNLTTMEVCY